MSAQIIRMPTRRAALPPRPSASLMMQLAVVTPGRTVDYGEATYFEGFAFAHIAAWSEHQRLCRIRQQCQAIIARQLGGR